MNGSMRPKTQHFYSHCQFSQWSHSDWWMWHTPYRVRPENQPPYGTVHIPFCDICYTQTVLYRWTLLDPKEWYMQLKNVLPWNITIFDGDFLTLIASLTHFSRFSVPHFRTCSWKMSFSLFVTASDRTATEHTNSISSRLSLVSKIYRWKSIVFSSFGDCRNFNSYPKFGIKSFQVLFNQCVIAHFHQCSFGCFV